MNAPRRKRNSPKVNLVLSAVFHVVVITALVFVAAREGMLGKQMQKITVALAPKEKPPEKPKEKEEPKVEPPKQEQPKPAVAPKLAAAPPPAAAAPSVTAPPSVAPPAAALPSFDFAGGKPVESTADPIALYKGYVEFTLRSRWVRPEGIQDASYAAEVEVHVDSSGKIIGTDWKKGSGDSKWDGSVKQVLAQTTSIGRQPPKGFPDHFLVRFDVQTDDQIDATASIQ